METILGLRLNSTFQIPVSSLQPIALPAVFGLTGLLTGTWASRIPAIQDGLQISYSVLSLVLLCGGLGGVLSSAFAALMVRKLGDRRLVFYAGLGLCMVLPAIGFAPNVSILMLAVLLLGLTSGCIGIGMNSLATKEEEVSGRSRMSMLHACGCAGSLAGALIASVVASADIEPSSHFIKIAIPIGLLLWVIYHLLDANDRCGAVVQKKYALPSGRVILFGVLGFCAVMSENSIAVWSGVFLKEHFGVTAGFAPLGLSAFTVMMVLARLIGDKLKGKCGASCLVSVGACISAAGLFLAVFALNPYLALAGFGCSGLGLALVFPFIMSAVGKEGPLALTLVITMANMSSLIGPPVIGTIADYLGMQVTIGFIGLLSLVISLIAARSTILK